MSTERELFEEWVFADSEMKAWANPKANYRRPDGRYFYAHAEIAWAAWQAARSADTSGARWVSVDERMPDTDDEVLVWVTSPWAKTAYSMVDSWYLHREDPTGMGGPTLEMGYLWRENDAEDVTHWMSLPEPPPAAPGGPAGARRPDENSPSGPSDRALNPQPEAVDHDRGAR